MHAKKILKGAKGKAYKEQKEKVKQVHFEKKIQKRKIKHKKVFQVRIYQLYGYFHQMIMINILIVTV